MVETWQYNSTQPFLQMFKVYVHLQLNQNTVQFRDLQMRKKSLNHKSKTFLSVMDAPQTILQLALITVEHTLKSLMSANYQTGLEETAGNLQEKNALMMLLTCTTVKFTFRVA
jgi:hypothetical protein